MRPPLQANMFRDLNKILAAKIESLKRQEAEDGTMESAPGMTNMLVMD